MHRWCSGYNVSLTLLRVVGSIPPDAILNTGTAHARMPNAYIGVHGRGMSVICSARGAVRAQLVQRGPGVPRGRLGCAPGGARTWIILGPRKRGFFFRPPDDWNYRYSQSNLRKTRTELGLSPCPIPSPTLRCNCKQRMHCASIP